MQRATGQEDKQWRCQFVVRAGLCPRAKVSKAFCFVGFILPFWILRVNRTGPSHYEAILTGTYNENPVS